MVRSMICGLIRESESREYVLGLSTAALAAIWEIMALEMV